jgi:hypothetical protein
MLNNARMLFAVLVIAGALVLPSAPTSAAGDCSPKSLAKCRDTNQLVWSASFEDSLRRFFGHRRADYLHKGKPLVSDQTISVLGGPPDAPQRIGDLWRFTACRSHSCSERGAAVLKPGGELIAVAIMHSRCAEPGHTLDCSSHWTLSIFTRPSSHSKMVVENLSKWGKSDVGGGDNPQGLPVDRLDDVEVIDF